MSASRGVKLILFFICQICIVFFYEAPFSIHFLSLNPMYSYRPNSPFRLRKHSVGWHSKQPADRVLEERARIEDGGIGNQVRSSSHKPLSWSRKIHLQKCQRD
jgi:hypothetical protein